MFLKCIIFLVVLNGCWCASNMLSTTYISYGESCEHAIAQLGHSQGIFIDCVTNHSVPVKLCIGCLRQFEEMKSKYASLKDNEECANTIFDKDRINMIVTTQTLLSGLWERAYCDNCQTNNNSSVFDDILTKFRNCLNTTAPASVCVQCLNEYTAVNTFYINLDNEYNGDVCYDIQDAMNRTRLHWSKKLGCCKRDFNVELFIITASVIASLPVVFYAGIYFYAKRREVNHDILTEQDSAMDGQIAALMNNVVINGFARSNAAPKGSTSQPTNAKATERLKASVDSDSDDALP